MAQAADPRVAVLEEIAAATRSTLVEIRDDARGLRSETNQRVDALDQRLSGEIGGAQRYEPVSGDAGRAPVEQFPVAARRHLRRIWRTVLPDRPRLQMALARERD